MRFSGIWCLPYSHSQDLGRRSANFESSICEVSNINLQIVERTSATHVEEYERLAEGLEKWSAMEDYRDWCWYVVALGVAIWVTNGASATQTQIRAWSRLKVLMIPRRQSMWRSGFRAWGGADKFSSFYLGKKVAFVYRAQKEIRGSKIRVIWGKVTRPHGTFLSKAHW